VPLADEAAGDLDRLYKQSRWQGEGDLVFAHPQTGKPLSKANVTRRMRAALKAAKLDTAHRFHDLRHTFGTLAQCSDFARGAFGRLFCEALETH
jgi:integrase